jgi:ribose 5-phosphate isomerase A
VAIYSEDVAQKHAAAERAVREVQDGMIVGLGTGTTAEQAVRALGARVTAGLQIQGVPTSERTAQLARELGIPLVPLAGLQQIDLTIDGADEIVTGSLAAIKGRGGALVREKLVAVASRRMVVVADASKVVGRLGEHTPVPVEVIPFGQQLAIGELRALGGEPVLRMAGDEPYRTDNFNHVLDVRFGPIDDPWELAARIKALPGVVDHGLFVDLVAVAYVGMVGGVRELKRG